MATSPAAKPPTGTCAAYAVAGAFAALSRVEKVDISQRIECDGRGSYVMEVFLRPDAHALRRQRAARNIFQRAEPPRVSDYQVDHGYAEFTKLRDSIGVLVRHQRVRDQCAYCAGLSAYLRGEWWLPSVGLRLTTTKRVKMRVLATFANRLLEAAVSSEALATASPSCRACVHVPLLIEQFLRRPRESSLGII